MIFLAVSTLDKIKSIPPNVWLKLALAVAALIAVIVVLRKVAQVNKVVLAIVVLIVLSIVGFSWIYERNEPKVLTPVIDKIAPFFPAKDSYGSKQKTVPKGAR
jgi:glucan phosphoethanolaminetransferase (alkaline phosphatase superfamily)